MKKYVLNENERAASGGYTRLIVLDYDDGDFSAAATSQSYALHNIAMGDLVQLPLCKVYVKSAVTGIFSPVIRVGYDATVDDTDFLLGATAGATLTVSGTIIPANPLSAAAGGPVSYGTASGMVGIAATISGGSNIVNATAGVLHIYLAYVPVFEFERPTGVGYEDA